MLRHFPSSFVRSQPPLLSPPSDDSECGTSLCRASDFPLASILRSFLLVLALAVGLGAAPAQAQFTWPDDVDPKSDRLSRLVGPELAALSAAGGKKAPESAFLPTDLILGTDDRVGIHAVATGSAQALRADLRQLGLTRGMTAEGAVSGFLPRSAIGELSRLSTLEFARPIYRPLTNAGRVTSEGDRAMYSNEARERYDVSGKGITVGVLSDSYDNQNGAGIDVGYNDLPAQSEILLDYPADTLGAESDEGRAMMQIIHDVAPEAKLSFHTAFFGRVGFARGIRRLAEAGADVIVDDIVYLNQPFFQDGRVARAVDEVTENGTAFFSSAGNYADQSYHSEFRRSGDTLRTNVGWYLPHDFDPGPGTDTRQRFTLGAGEEIRISFQWDQPFAIGGSGGSRSDYDLIIVNDQDSVVAAGLTNNFGADPVELASLTNRTDTTATYELLLLKFLGNPAIPGDEGPDADELRYVEFIGQAQFEEYRRQGATVFGHARAEGAEAVGASFYLRTPAFSGQPPQLEPFSSVGAIPVLFGDRGRRLPEPIVRRKPEVIAPDGVNTTFFGFLIRDFDGDFFPNFFGTSAAAPHAAAVGALMLEAGGGPGSLAPQTLYDRMERGALDMDNPRTAGPDPGFDPATGYGFIQADSAVARAFNSPPIANDDRQGIAPGQISRLRVLENDSDPDGDSLYVASVTNGRFGTATVPADSQAILYEAPAFLPGPDSIRYTVSDGFREARAWIHVEALADEVVLEPNVPNPFHTATTIPYTLPRPQPVRLTVFNLAGQKITTLVDRIQQAGPHEVQWRPGPAAGGVYFYRLVVGETATSKKMVFIP